MSGRCVILVDASYLLSATATRLAGRPSRASLQVDYEKLFHLMRTLAQEQTGCPLLRTLWYDAAQDARPSAEQRRIAMMADVKVRLGELVIYRDGQTRQKGVDAFLQRDIATLAANKAVSDMVLVTGDDDLRRAVEEAQDFGVRVHLWGVEAGDQVYAQSHKLVMEADRRYLLTSEVLSDCLSLKDSSSANTFGVAALVEAVPETDLGGDVAHVEVADAADDVHAPTPASLPKSVRRVAVGADGFSGVNVYRAPSAFSPLTQVSTPKQKFDDKEFDLSHPDDDPAAVGARYATRWLERSDVEQIVRLQNRSDRSIPRELDSDLLRYAEGCGLDTWDDEQAKFAVRNHFSATIGAYRVD